MKLGELVREKDLIAYFGIKTAKELLNKYKYKKHPKLKVIGGKK